MDRELYVLISRLHVHKKKQRNKSFVLPIHNTNFGLKYAPEGFEIDPTPKSHLWKFSFSPTPLIPSRSLRISMHFSSCLSCHLPKEASGGQSHSATVLLCAAKLFAEITIEGFFVHSVAIGWVAALYNSSKAHTIRHQQVCVCERDKARVKASERGGGTSRLTFNTKWDCLHLLPEEPWEIRPSLSLCSFLLASVMFHFCSLQRGAFWQPRRFRFCAIGHFHNLYMFEISTSTLC